MTSRPRVLVLARSYPNDVLPSLGLWTERPTVLLQEHGCDMHVVSPVPYCPPLPSVGPLRQYARFRSVCAISDIRRPNSSARATRPKWRLPR